MQFEAAINNYKFKLEQMMKDAAKVLRDVEEKQVEGKPKAPARIRVGDRIMPFKMFRKLVSTVYLLNMKALPSISAEDPLGSKEHLLFTEKALGHAGEMLNVKMPARPTALDELLDVA